MHVHIGAGQLINFALHFILFAFLWRLVESLLSDNPIGRAMAFIL